MMEAFKLFATGGQSTIDDFAKNVYIKNNLTKKLEDVIHEIKREFLRISGSSCDSLKQFENQELIVTDVTIQYVNDFLILIESIILHGLKEKLTFSKVLSPVRFSYNSNRFPIQSAIKNRNNCPDFWSVVLILNHNQVNLRLKNLNNIKTDIGRCRAWIRLALNDDLLSSYLRALTNDTSLLHGFYRPSAYLRDKEHMDRFLSLIDSLENIKFNLNYDYKSLNSWNNECLILSGLSDKIEMQDENALDPVMPAIDALNLLKVDDNEQNFSKNNKKPNCSNTTDKNLDLNSVLNSLASNVSASKENSKIQIKTGWSTSPPEPRQRIDDFNNDDDKISTKSTVHHLKNNEKEITNKLTTSNKSSIRKKSINKPIKIKIKTKSNLDDCSYDSLLQSYSDEVNLCSTPEIRTIYIPPIPISSNNLSFDSTTSSKKVNNMSKKATQNQLSGDRVKFKQQHNYEVIPQSLVLDNSDEATQRFLSKFFKIQNEIGLDKQDYKCYKCGRPIGMVYGRSRLCKYDGFHYCLDCNQDEKAIIPARVIHNWDFNKYTISRENKEKLDLVENEPLINIKLTNPLLYQFNSIMKECLQLRTQLFFLHAYLFTCQESIALDLRKQVWPSEHLFEHIHLYSLNDLQQALNGNLFINLKKSITLAKKHVLSCILCSQKGFICEICSSSKIIYPFDVDTTYRCDSCKGLFHFNCIFINNQASQQQITTTSGDLGTTDLVSKRKLKQKPCPRCLRIQCREKIQKIRMA